MTSRSVHRASTHADRSPPRSAHDESTRATVRRRGVRAPLNVPVPAAVLPAGGPAKLSPAHGRSRSSANPGRCNWLLGVIRPVPRSSRQANARSERSLTTLEGWRCRSGLWPDPLMEVADHQRVPEPSSPSIAITRRTRRQPARRPHSAQTRTPRTPIPKRMSTGGTAHSCVRTREPAP